MNTKLVGLLVAVVILLLGVIVWMMTAGKSETPVSAPTAVAAPPPTDLPKPNPRGGSFKKSPPGKYEYTTPK